jgi:hypothetical protein
VVDVRAAGLHCEEGEGEIWRVLLRVKLRKKKRDGEQIYKKKRYRNKISINL